MKNFCLCLFMLLLVMLGKHNGARLKPAPDLAQRPTPPAEPLKFRPAAGASSRVMALVAQ